jgi:hypothetical protein
MAWVHVRALQINPGDATASKTKGMIVAHIASMPLPQNNTRVANRTNSTQQEANKTAINKPGFNPTLANATSVQPLTQSRATPQNAVMSGFMASGTIHSLVFVPKSVWIATGNWTLLVDGGTAKFFDTKMKWYKINGEATHTHEFKDFKSSNSTVLAQPDNSVNITGNMNVGTNGHVSWQRVPTVIEIHKGKTISISVDDQKTNHHFAGQRILGIFISFTPCSDTPGPNMEIVAACNPPGSVGASTHVQGKNGDAGQFIIGKLVHIN